MGRTLRKLGITSALLIVAGAAIVVTAPEPPEGLGWFAYAPLSDEVYEPPTPLLLPVVLSGRELFGVVAVVIGLLLASLAAGIRLGQRQVG